MSRLSCVRESHRGRRIGPSGATVCEHGSRCSRAAGALGGGSLISEHADDKALVARCQEELPFRTAAFEQLVRRYEVFAYRACLRILGDESDADDACQEVFLRVFRNLKGFEHRSSFKTWLARIVRNECLTLLSRRSRALETAITGDDEPGAVAEPEILGTEALVSSREQLEKTFARLPRQDREVLALRFIAELSLEELTDILDISPSAAKMRLYRAIERFVRICREIREPDNGGADGGPAMDPM